MYQPIETSAARTIWIDSPTQEMLGFANSSRVQIDRDPTGALDWESAQTKGEAFRATLMGGMWPDDDELRLLVVGVVPGSDDAKAYLQHIIPNTTPLDISPDDVDNIKVTEAAILKQGWKILKQQVLIMPAFGGSLTKSIFVKLGTPIAEVQDIKAAATDPTPDPRPEKKISFDMWRIQVDMKLLRAKYAATDEWNTTEIEGLDLAYKLDTTPDEFVLSWIHNELQTHE